MEHQAVERAQLETQQVLLHDAGLINEPQAHEKTAEYEAQLNELSSENHRIRFNISL